MQALSADVGFLLNTLSNASTFGCHTVLVLWWKKSQMYEVARLVKERGISIMILIT